MRSSTSSYCLRYAMQPSLNMLLVVAVVLMMVGIQRFEHTRLGNEHCAHSKVLTKSAMIKTGD